MRNKLESRKDAPPHSRSPDAQREYLFQEDEFMLIGAAIFATDYAMRPDELARELEQRGYESLWLPEHTHIPASRRTPYPVGGDLPKEYWQTYDPFLALTAAAAATKKLRLATGICLIIQRDPIITAKESVLSARVRTGVGSV
jgi:hypothetical protein